MQTSKILIAGILLLFTMGCRNTNVKTGSLTTGNVADTAKSRGVVISVDKIKSKGFVLSCGSGCALRYTAKAVVQTGDSINVRFEIEMFINEALEETNLVNYTFIYKGNEIRKVQFEDENENLLEMSTPDGQYQFKQFADSLIHEINHVN